MQRNFKVRYKQNFREKIVKHINENINVYFKVLIFFIIGICIGIFTVNQLPDVGKQTISNYINNSISKFKEQTEIQKWQLLKNSLFKNIIIVFIIWFFSLTMLGSFILYFITLIMGITFGYSFAAIMTSFTFIQGILFFFTSMFLQNIITIPSITFLIVQGIKSHETLKVKHNISLKYVLAKNSAYAILIALLLLIASLIEVYLSSSLVYAILKYL